LGGKIKNIIEGVHKMLMTNKKSTTGVGSVREMVIGAEDERFIENSDLSLSIYRDKASGIIYVNISDRNKPDEGLMITAEAAFHMAETVHKVFNQKVNALVSNSLN